MPLATSRENLNLTTLHLSVTPDTCFFYPTIGMYVCTHSSTCGWRVGGKRTPWCGPWRPCLTGRLSAEIPMAASRLAIRSNQQINFRHHSSRRIRLGLMVRTIVVAVVCGCSGLEQEERAVLGGSFDRIQKSQQSWYDGSQWLGRRTCTVFPAALLHSMCW